MQGVGRFPPWVILKWAFTSLCLNYSAAAFLVSSRSPVTLVCPDSWQGVKSNTLHSKS